MHKLIKRWLVLGVLLSAGLLLNANVVAAPAPTIYYVQNDQLGTPREVVDSNNVEVWRWEGDAYGNERPNQDPSNTGNAFVFNLRYPGQYYDTETGRMYNGWRDYDPAVGRYVQSDPFGLLGGQWSTYGYVNGNPTNAIDPSGMETVLPGPIPLPIPFPTLPGRSGNEDDYGLNPPSLSQQINSWLNNNIYNKPPKDATDPNGAKAPGKPGRTEGFCEPKKGAPTWGRAPNGRGSGWIDADGNVWVPTGPSSGSTGDAHGGPHWDVQKPGGGYDNVYPGGRRR